MPGAAPLLLLHGICWWLLVLVVLLPSLPISAPTNPPTFISYHDSRLNHLLLDASSGYVYVGAVNSLYHLSPDLQLISWGKTGPVLDSPDCLPPIEPKDCSQTSVTEYPCGGEHTPSPITSFVNLQATPAITWATLITAVAVATEDGHTIALLGDTNGQLHKVFVHVNGSGSQYDSVKVAPQSPVNADLLLDSTLRNVYVMTESKVTRLPVAQCERLSDCQSCLSVRDPYCGWCSLEGRCTRKLECSRHSQSHHWLWSYGHDRQCVSILRLDPAIQSREEQTQAKSGDG